jgi:hypothetical protein
MSDRPSLAYMASERVQGRPICPRCMLYGVHGSDDDACLAALRTEIAKLHRKFDPTFQTQVPKLQPGSLKAVRALIRNAARRAATLVRQAARRDAKAERQRLKAKRIHTNKMRRARQRRLSAERRGR